ncbi:MAG: hypothetical protein LBT70_01995 [Holosporaceae bacterium]|jgi:hypothetical protein|nr:hypothetical protein [Holosporaceae bacterium]
MKKILMLAVGVSQFLLLPQINAVTETKKIITVPEDFEIKNGLLGLDRDAHLMMSEKIAQDFQLTDAVNKIRNFLGISQRTFAYKDHKKFEYMVSLELKRQIFQQPMVAKKSNETLYNIISNDKDKFIALGLFPDYSYHRIVYSTDGGSSWIYTNISAQEVKYMNGKFFAFGAEKIEDGKNEGFFCGRREGVDIYVSNDGIAWDPFFELSKNNKAFGDKVADFTMACGDDRYVMVTENGTVFTKREHDKDWAKSPKKIDEEIPTDVYFSFPPCKDGNLSNLKIIYARKIFALQFDKEWQTFYYTSKDGIDWKYVKNHNVVRGFDVRPRYLVGGSFGFAHIDDRGELYYSPSGDAWHKVELPKENDTSGDFLPLLSIDHSVFAALNPSLFPEDFYQVTHRDSSPFTRDFKKVIYFASSFYGDMFIALTAYDNYALLGIPVADYIKWSWAELKISFAEKPIKNQDIECINCVGKKIIIQEKSSYFADLRVLL